jgi:hypothetical protein
MRQMMNNTESNQDRGLTTEQIASAGSAPAQEDDVLTPTGDQGYDDDVLAPAGGRGYEDDALAPAGDQGYEDDNAAPVMADQEAPGYAGRGTAGAGGNGSAAAASGTRAMLLEDGELQDITMRWKDIQAEFVDEPKVAVREADALVADLMQRLAAMFAAERAELEDRWAGGSEVSTEDLRQGLRRYRSFFERLLAA